MRPAAQRSPGISNRPPLRRRLHRITGIAAGCVILYLAATGLPLQFTSGLDLGSRYITSPMLLDWYGIRAADAGWESNGVLFLGDQIFFGTTRVAQTSGFQGAVRLPDLVVVAAGEDLLLFSEAASTVLDTLSFGESIDGLGLAEHNVFVRMSSGEHRLDPQTFELGPPLSEPGPAVWAQPRQVDPATLARYANLSRSRVLTLERLIQDLHSGRAFGTVGEWLIDLASVALAVLVLTGYWIWWRSR